MIIAPMDANRLVPIVEQVVASGIPTIAMDSAINPDKFLTLVTADNFRTARVLGE